MNRKTGGTPFASQHVEYSIGSVREQIIHLMSVDNVWFCPLRGEENPAYFSPAEFEDRDAIRTQWDKVEQDMRDYFTALRDELLFEKSFPGGEKEVLYLWQVLLHVVNHGTDRRAQIRRIIHDFGVDTAPQDYIFYVNDNL